jgi:CRP/FNR family transcriptional regulator, anaerobic regulatory protein
MVSETTAQGATGHRRQVPCAFCVLRHRGLCQGVDDQDVAGSAALNASHSPIRVYEEGETIFAQGDRSQYVFNLISGWVALHRDLSDGRRQIIQILQPGAMFGAEPAGQELGHGATAITNASACPIERTKLDELRHQISSLNERFILMLEQANHHLFESQTTIGQGSAAERIGGLLSELAAAAAGEGPIHAGAVIRMPLTQRHIAEATGLTAIHVNRILRLLREDGVIELHNGMLTVINAVKLKALRAPGASPIPAMREANGRGSGAAFGQRGSRARLTAIVARAGQFGVA